MTTWTSNDGLATIHVGDVLQRDGVIRLVISRRGSSLVRDVGTSELVRLTDARVDIDVWRQWAADAEIIHRGGDL